MSVVTPITTIAVGVVVERSKGASLWSDFLWRPVVGSDRRAGDAALDAAVG